MKTGCVYLVGAGCGRADLITLRGKNRLEHCDAVVYDDLIDPAVLDFAPAGTDRIYMGKREGRHSALQEEINAKLVELAGQGKTVVRLKGGDPFVFGRGGEEILALQQASVPFEEVPGISSAIAIPAGAGIPVTHRGLSRSVHIITGHTADRGDGLPADLFHLAQCDGTLVFLMGLKRLEPITQKLIEYGRPAHTPAAVLSGGNSPNPAAVRGTLADIAQRAKGVLPPAVIVVGETAALDLSATIPAPMAGIRIGLTGTAAITGKLMESMQQLGADVRRICGSRVEERMPDLQLLCRERPKWIVLTSPNGVEALFRQLSRQKIDLRRLGCCRFAVIGPATAAALERHGLFADLCPEQHTSAALARALVAAAAPEEEIFLLRSARGATVLKQVPEDVGFAVHDIALYDTVRDPVTAHLGFDAVERLDYLTFCSAGGVEEFFRQYGNVPGETVCVCIGSVTAAALRTHTDAPVLVAEETTARGVVQAILKHMEV